MRYGRPPVCPFGERGTTFSRYPWTAVYLSEYGQVDHNLRITITAAITASVPCHCLNEEHNG